LRDENFSFFEREKKITALSVGMLRVSSLHKSLILLFKKTLSVLELVFPLLAHNVLQLQVDMQQ
jgi:hypothetical protein